MCYFLESSGLRQKMEHYCLLSDWYNFEQLQVHAYFCYHAKITKLQFQNSVATFYVASYLMWKDAKTPKVFAKGAAALVKLQQLKVTNAVRDGVIGSPKLIHKAAKTM